MILRHVARYSAVFIFSHRIFADSLSDTFKICAANAAFEPCQRELLGRTVARYSAVFVFSCESRRQHSKHRAEFDLTTICRRPSRVKQKSSLKGRKSSLMQEKPSRARFADDLPTACPEPQKSLANRLKLVGTLIKTEPSSICRRFADDLSRAAKIVGKSS